MVMHNLFFLSLLVHSLNAVPTSSELVRFCHDFDDVDRDFFLNFLYFLQKNHNRTVEKKKKHI